MELSSGHDPEVMTRAIRAVARATALATWSEEVMQSAVDMIGEASQLVAMEAAPDDWVSQVRAQTAVVGAEAARTGAAAVYEHIASAAASLASAAGRMGDFVDEHETATDHLPREWYAELGTA
ncbi:MAG TPA: hypothetical protein VGQ42_11915 [Candidatus Dormibacteraeota bacterium]|jgi:hypothetical protein|nr:hypothetical protein [Candidatus Dormibacteraeota bacterium]